ACFDDSLLRKVLPRWLAARVPLGTPASWPAFSAGASDAGKDAGAPKYGILESLGLERSSPYDIAAMVLTVLVALLSIAPVANMLSPNQVMNTSFNRLHLVNTYGAFGSVGRVRNEIVFEGTEETVITPQTKWKEYEFKA